MIKNKKINKIEHHRNIIFQCNLCGAGYVSYTCRHLHQRIEEHKVSAIGNHLKEQHDIAPDDIVQFFLQF